MGSDPGNAGADLGSPQTWNGYAYVNNNPMNATDPDGMIGSASGGGGGFLDFLVGLANGIGSLFGAGGGSLEHVALPASGSTDFVAASSNTSQANPDATEVGFWEGLIPIWGSGKQAYYDLKRGCVVGGAVSGALAISDVFLVRAVGGSLVKGAWKTGSHSWGATRKWYGATRELEYGQQVHHWAIPQGGWGKAIPNSVKNQPWNLMKIVPPEGISQGVWHQGLHGVGPLKNEMGSLERIWYGTPDWLKNGIANGSGRIARTIDWVNCK